jgi:acyl-CoA synthetase (AMP-forming)/AMP-acid ligase II
MVTSRVGNVTDFLLAGKASDRVCLRLLHAEHTYGELQRASHQIATHLLLKPVAKGDRIILISENSFFWVASYLGILRAGLICVPLPTSISQADLELILQTTEARVAFVQGGSAMRHRSHFGGVDVVTDRDEVCAVTSDHPAALPSVHPGDIAALMFTAGSTGKPRGVMVTHGNIMANTESIIQYLHLAEEDRIMTVLPFHYCFGTSLLHTHLRAGGSLVIDSRFLYPETVLRRMAETRCTGFAGVPSHFQILLRNSSLWKKSFPDLRYVQQAGGHLAPFFVRELRKALPTTQVFVMYGQTEATARLSYLEPDMLKTKPGSIGKGIPGVTLRVVNEWGEEVRPGELGEIVAEGENIALGYWRDPQESARSFRGGKLHTGDLARVDEDGFIYIVDRARDILKCGGTRVSCRHIEDQLLECEDLLEAAVIGMPDDDLGEAVKAFVVPRGSESESSDLKERVRLFCKKCMPAQLVPREIVVLAALPKNSAGKVLKAQLKAT